jgi:nucleotide-binding universal stress UspA family protein
MNAMLGLVVVAALAFGAGAWMARATAAFRTRARDAPPPGPRRILLPFTGTSISRRSFDAAMRLARAEDATIMPALLAQVPRQLPFDAPLPNLCLRSMPLLEAIEQRAIAQGVAVDSRVSRGRSYRDALRRLVAEEPVDSIIISATGRPRTGLSESDLQWLLQKAPAEILILRPDMRDRRVVGVETGEPSSSRLKRHGSGATPPPTATERATRCSRAAFSRCSSTSCSTQRCWSLGPLRSCWPATLSSRRSNSSTWSLLP